jgi:mediator of RNA polymerase II transcription subunit 10
MAESMSNNFQSSGASQNTSHGQLNSQQSTAEASSAAITSLEDSTVKILETLYTLSVATSGYAGPETTQTLSTLFSQLPDHLSALHSLSTNPHTRDALPAVPNELVEYVDGGRNPDVYTREFVELALRGGQDLRGKTQAFESFANVLREGIARADPEGMGKIIKEGENASIGNGS